MSVPFRTVARLGSLALAIAATAGHAAVVVSTPNLNLGNLGGTDAPASKTTLVDVDGDATNDFSFTHSTDPVTTPDPVFPISKTDYNGKLTLDAATAGQILAVVKDADGTQTADFNAPAYLGNYAETLAVGSTVGPASALIGLGDAAYDNRLLDSSGTNNGGAFSAATGELTPSGPFDGVAYVGFKLGANYGYLEFTGIASDSFGLFGFDENSATLSGIAYETTPDTAITVEVIAAPEPASLVVLAGLATLALGRRRRRD